MRWIVCTAAMTCAADLCALYALQIARRGLTLLLALALPLLLLLPAGSGKREKQASLPHRCGTCIVESSDACV